MPQDLAHRKPGALAPYRHGKFSQVELKYPNESIRSCQGDRRKRCCYASESCAHERAWILQFTTRVVQKYEPVGRFDELQYPQGLPTGEAVITTAGKLNARYVIHTVGPIKGVHGAGDAELLASCYRRDRKSVV